MKAQATGELVIWLYRFLLISAIAFALVIIIGNKYTEKFDVRQMESVILSEKIAGCIEKTIFSENSIKACIGANDFDYQIIINMPNKSLEFGNNDLKVQCELLRKGTKFEKAPSCNSFKYLLLIENKLESAEISTAIGKHDKNLE